MTDYAALMKIVDELSNRVWDVAAIETRVKQMME